MERLPISKLANNTGQIDGVPANPRTIKKDDYDKLIKSLQEDPDFLNHKPLHVYQQGDKYVVLGGNQRLKALKELDYKEVPCTLYKPETPPEVLRARVMKDNAEFGSWDMDMLANEWSDYDLDGWGVDLPDDWLQDEQEVIEDEAPEVDESEPPVSKLGEIYQLGRHRVMCGDSVNLEDAKKLMGEQKAEMTFTDPPYLMGFEGNVHGDGSKSFNATHGAIKNDKMSKDEGDNFIYSIFQTLHTYVNGAYYVCFYRLGLDYIFRALDKLKNKHRAVIIWDKGNHTLSNSDYMSKYEPIVYGWFNKHNFYGGRSNFDIWNIDRTAKNELHPTMKPIELCSKAIQNSSKKDDIVLDLFLGSGSTLIACEQTDRTCYGCELDPRYIDVIIRRFVKFTNGEQEVIRLSDGKDVRQEYLIGMSVPPVMMAQVAHQVYEQLIEVTQ